MKIVFAALVVVLGCGTANAQSRQPSFEAATIRQLPPEEGTGARSTGIGIITQDPSLISYKQISLKSLLMRAYGLKDFQISGPDWIDSGRYDLMAKLPPGTGTDQIPSMLQQLVTERFRMTLHWDTVQESAYALVIGKGGAKLTPSVDQSGDQPDKARSINLSSAEPVKLNGATTAALADFLSHVLRQPVVDSTGLQGRFDITLNIPYKDLLAARQLSVSPSADDSYTPSSIFDAVRDIGLRLDPEKTEVKKLTVVHADRVPSESE